MENIVNVEPRKAHGKGGARKLRETGKIPGVLYGHKEKALSFSLDPHSFRKKMTASGYGRNTVLSVKGLEREVLALLKATQVDPVRRDLLHVDLIEVREDEAVTLKIPVVFEGRASGVRAGGSQQVLRRQISVRTTPLNIPKQLVVDVTKMEIAETCRAEDVKLPEGVTLFSRAKESLLTILAPKNIEEAADEEAADES
jgi:large subunit ribosomal protein L25